MRTVVNGNEVPHLWYLSNADLDAIQTEINEQTLLVSRATKNKEWKLDRLNHLADEFKALAKFIGSNRKPKIPTEKWLAEQKAAAKEQAKKDAIALAEREKKLLDHAQAELEKWKAGQPAYNLRILPFDYMRIEGDEIATTKGARVPLEHVRKVAPLIVSLIERGESYRRNGHSIHLGNYVIDSLSSDGTLIVGCHKFNKEEILRVANLLA